MDQDAINDKLFGGQAIQPLTQQGGQGFATIISSILPTVYIVAGFILFIYLIAGGFMIISSAGDTKQTEQGQHALTNAIIGFVLIFTSFWIIQIIEYLTGIPIVSGNKNL